MSTIPPPAPLPSDIQRQIEAIATEHCPQALPCAFHLARVAWRGVTEIRGRALIEKAEEDEKNLEQTKKIPRPRKAKNETPTDMERLESAQYHLSRFILELSEMPWLLQEEIHKPFGNDKFCFHFLRGNPPPQSLAHTLDRLDLALIEARKSIQDPVYQAMRVSPFQAPQPKRGAPPARHNKMVCAMWRHLKACGANTAQASALIALLLNDLSIDNRPPDDLSESIRKMIERCREGG